MGEEVHVQMERKVCVMLLNASQGMPRIAGKHQKPEKRREDSFL
jgi:hypothetical protein